MRCKCCDSANARMWKGDYYCPACRSSIRETIREDKERYEEDFEYYIEKDWDKYE